MLHSPDSRCRVSYSPFATEALCLRKISGRNKPASVQPKGFLKETFTRECSFTSTRVIEAERTGLLIQSQDGNSSAAGNLELLLQNRGEKSELSVCDAGKWKWSDDRNESCLHDNLINSRWKLFSLSSPTEFHSIMFDQECRNWFYEHLLYHLKGCFTKIANDNFFLSV